LQIFLNPRCGDGKAEAKRPPEDGRRPDAIGRGQADSPAPLKKIYSFISDI